MKIFRIKSVFSLLSIGYCVFIAGCSFQNPNLGKDLDAYLAGKGSRADEFQIAKDYYGENKFNEMNLVVAPERLYFIKDTIVDRERVDVLMCYKYPDYLVDDYAVLFMKDGRKWKQKSLSLDKNIKAENVIDKSKKSLITSLYLNGTGYGENVMKVYQWDDSIKNYKMVWKYSDMYRLITPKTSIEKEVKINFEEDKTSKVKKLHAKGYLQIGKNKYDLDYKLHWSDKYSTFIVNEGKIIKGSSANIGKIIALINKDYDLERFDKNKCFVINSVGAIEQMFLTDLEEIK